VGTPARIATAIAFGRNTASDDSAPARRRRYHRPLHPKVAIITRRQAAARSIANEIVKYRLGCLCVQIGGKLVVTITAATLLDGICSPGYIDAVCSRMLCS
jgi:hypothetical protein